MHTIGVVVKLTFKEYLNETKKECPICGGEGVAPVRGNPTDPANQEAVAKCWKCKGKGHLNEAKYYLPTKSGYDVESKRTDDRLSPYERGKIAGGQDSISLDWNDETDEYNPYPPGSEEFEEYNKGFWEQHEYIRNRFPDI